jgi:hypothetical protein
VAALFYSLLESAKACGIDEQTYLLRAAHSALANPQVTFIAARSDDVASLYCVA